MPYAYSAQAANGRPARRIGAGMVALLLVAGAFLAYSLPPYLTLDPTRSRIAPPAGSTSYYPLLVGHVVFGSVAMLGGCLQVWTWLRGRYPVLHRRIGYLYVFGGVLPAGLMGLTLGAMTPFGPVLRASDVLLAIVWLGVTFAGVGAARRGEYDRHRRWMIRSVVLTLSVITNRAWGVVWFLALSPQLATTFGGSETLLVQTIAGLSGWLGWTIPLLAAEAWLEARPTLIVYGRGPVPARAPTRASATPPHG
jgi:uncharacterized membrane protein